MKKKIGKIRKGVDCLSGFQYHSKVTQIQKPRYNIVNVSKKGLSKIIRKFEKPDNLPYEWKRPKNDPTDSYVYLERQIAKCMMRSDALNWHNYGGYTEINSSSMTVCSTGEDK